LPFSIELFGGINKFISPTRMAGPIEYLLQ